VKREKKKIKTMTNNMTI